MKNVMQTVRFLIMVVLLFAGTISIFSQLESDKPFEWTVIALSFGGLLFLLLIEWFLYLWLPPNLDDSNKFK